MTSSLTQLGAHASARTFLDSLLQEALKREAVTNVISGLLVALMYVCHPSVPWLWLKREADGCASSPVILPLTLIVFSSFLPLSSPQSFHRHLALLQRPLTHFPSNTRSDLMSYISHSMGARARLCKSHQRPSGVGVISSHLPVSLLTPACSATLERAMTPCERSLADSSISMRAWGPTFPLA